MATYQVSPWDALGDPSRRAIFEHLAARPLAVGELAERLPISRPAVSQHLRVLREAGLVVCRAEGTRRVHAIHTAGIARLRADLDRFWTLALDAFKAVAEAEEAADDESYDKERAP